MQESKRRVKDHLKYFGLSMEQITMSFTDTENFAEEGIKSSVSAFFT